MKLASAQRRLSNLLQAGNNASLAKTHLYRLNRIPPNRLNHCLYVSVSSRIRPRSFFKAFVRVASKISFANLNSLLCIKRLVRELAQSFPVNHSFRDPQGFSLGSNCLVSIQGRMMVQAYNLENERQGMFQPTNKFSHSSRLAGQMLTKNIAQVQQKIQFLSDRQTDLVKRFYSM